jgi:hypothetical protein
MFVMGHEAEVVCLNRFSVGPLQYVSMYLGTYVPVYCFPAYVSAWKGTWRRALPFQLVVLSAHKIWRKPLASSENPKV